MDIRRDSLVFAIREAFTGVTRDGGVSWHEAANQIYEDVSAEECERRLAEFRSRDTDTSWEDMIWDPLFCFNGSFGFGHLDPIGFRYYLPAAMLQSLDRSREGEEHRFEIWQVSWTLTLGHTSGSMKSTLQRISLLNEAQLQATARFVNFAEAESKLNEFSFDEYTYLDDLAELERVSELVRSRALMDNFWVAKLAT